MAILVIIAGVLWLKSAPSKEKKGNKDGFTIVKGKHTVEIVVKNYGTIMGNCQAFFRAPSGDRTDKLSQI